MKLGGHIFWLHFVHNDSYFVLGVECDIQFLVRCGELVLGCFDGVECLVCCLVVVDGNG